MSYPFDLKLEDYIRASYPIIVVETFDPLYTEDRITRIADRLGKGATVEVQDLIGLKGQVVKYVDTLPDTKGKWSIIVLRNMHFFLQDKSFLQALHNFVRKVREKDKPCILIGTCPTIEELPAEIGREAVVVRDRLPEEEDLLGFAGALALEYGGKVEIPQSALPEVAKVGRGMTFSEFKRAFKLSLVKTKGLDPALFAEVKKQILRQSAALSLYQPLPTDKMDDLAGMESLKFFMVRTEGKIRGVLIMGPPGTGKTHFAKSLARKLGIPLIILDVGSLFHGIVGSSEARMRRMVAIVEAFGRCLLLVDEIEKGFSGLGGSGSTDGGTTQRTLSKFLTWLSDRRSLDACVIATCNAMSLPPEYIRAGRFSTIFYLGLPNQKVRDKAWEIHKRNFGIEEEGHPPDEGWSGAEIFQCCENAKAMNVSLAEAAGYTVRVSRVSKAQLEELRRFADEAGLVPADDPDEDDEDTSSIVVDA